jgi:hypothetical protein
MGTTCSIEGVEEEVSNDEGVEATSCEDVVTMYTLDGPREVITGKRFLYVPNNVETLKTRDYYHTILHTSAKPSQGTKISGTSQVLPLSPRQ